MAHHPSLMRLPIIKIAATNRTPPSGVDALDGTKPRPLDQDTLASRSTLMPGKSSIRLLTLLLRRPLVSSFLLGLIAFVIAFWLIQLGNPPPSHHESVFDQLGNESQTTAVALLIAVLIVPVLVVVVLRKTFFALVSIARGSAEKGRAPVLPFLAETIEQMESQLRDLQGTGVILESYEVANWVRRCFQTAGPSTRYVGTDSHVPSQYEDVYTDYLQAHSEFLEKSSLKSHARIMIVDMESLRTDKFGVPDSFQDFLEWHHKNEVRLAQLEPSENKLHFANPDEPKDLVDTDIGFWENKYVLLFKPIRTQEERERTLLRIAYFGEPLYEKCKEYMQWVENAASDVGDELPFYSEKLSTGWERFCDADERIKHTIPFLEEQVIARVPRGKDDIRIFDAATGIGIETTELIKQGYFVAANEIENSLRSAANAFARSRNVRIPAARFSKTDWLHLDDEHDRGVYDLVLVLGNSLCHLEGVNQLRTAVKQFARLLRPGGALVCDERNFEYIIQNWQVIQADPWNAFRFNRRPVHDRVMYYGDTVLGAPVDLTEKHRVIFSYTEVEHDEDERVVPKPNGEIGTLSMYPFKRGEMLTVLRETSQFATIDVYSDLKPTDDLDGDADFYTYVAWKAPGPSDTASG
jgi:glycine/sarcosine N-methyltransferase